MDLHPWPKKRRREDARQNDPEAFPPNFPETKDWYQELQEHSQDLMCIHDLEGRILSVNLAPARVLGYGADEMLQIPLRELLAPEFRSEFDAYLKQIERAGEAHGLMRVITRAGERRIWEYHCTLRTEAGRSPQVRSIAHDVTEQKQTEKRLREVSESLLDKVREGERTIRDLELFRTLLDRCNDAIEVVDPETLRFLDVNEKCCSDLGYSREELLAMTVPDINPARGEWSSARVTEMARKARSLVLDRVHRRKDGTLFPVEVSLQWLRLDREYVVAIVRDLTERKQVEAKLQASEKRYRALHDRAPIGICRVETRTGRYLEVNPKYCEIVGRTEEELLGLTVQTLTHPDDLAANIETMRQLSQGEVQHYQVERRRLRPDGSIRWLEVDAVAMWPEEQPAWHMSMVQDITERKLAEERLREYERVVEGLEENICVLDRDYRHVLANRAFLNYRGLQKEQVIGQPLSALLNEKLLALIKLRADECFQGKVVRFELKKTYPKLGERDIFATYLPIDGPNGVDRIAVVLQDITERKQTEEALQKSEEMFAKAFRQGPMSITLTSMKDHRYIDVNETFERMTGWRREEVLGRTPFDIGLWVNPQDRMDLAKQLLSEGSLRNVEAIFRRKDGAIRIGFGTADVIEVNGEPCAISVAADITERKQAEEALQRSEENYRLFVAQSSEGIYREELDQPLPVDLPENELIRGILHRSYVAECNDAMAALYGLARGEELHGKRLTEMLLPEDPRNQEFIRDYIRSGFRVVDRISHEVDIHGNPKVFLNSMIGTVCEGKLVSTWGIQRDITEKLALEEAHRKAEESLRQSEERLRVALSGSPIKVFNQDRDLRYTWVYNLQEGWTEKDYLGKSDEEIFGPEAGATMTAIKRPVLETGRRTRQEFTLNAHGKNYYCDLTVEPLRDAAGAVTGVNCACVDVTDLRAIAEELRLAKERLSEEKLYLEQTIDSELGFGEIIGRSSALKDVMEKVSKVAPSNATVLLQGETGTGKELVARALHRLSKRSTNSFIKLNCAAIPSGLLESELFGHEKGAFTGAVSRKIGRLELADQGTLFLDEVGEIPLSLQPKLLRVLQDQEFERLGSTQTLKVNFRLLAATNRNLLQSVKDGDFRSDLFYRLNVFPIVIPPLRDRREDVRVLVEHFVRHYASRMNKSITSIPSKTMEALVQWEWPGNIRELENFVERSVILTPGSVLQAPLGELRGSGVESDGGTLRDREREKIIRVLSECHGQLGGPNGAAARLGLKRTTLQSRLSQLGIKPEAYRR
jgi:PAS domain S-box-containing protein